MPTPKSSAMVGSEMLTMLPLRVLMKAPTDTAESTSHFRFFGERSCLDVTSNLLSGSCQRARPSARILDRYPFAEPLTPLPRQQYQGAVASEAGVLSKQDELLVVEEHLRVSLGQQVTEPWLRRCVGSGRGGCGGGGRRAGRRTGRGGGR